MTYLQRNKKEKKFKPVLIILGLILILSFFKVPTLQNIAYKIGEPFFTVSRYISKPLNPAISFFKNKAKLQKENDELKNRILELESQVVSIEMLKDENEELRKISKNQEEGKVGKIITRPPNSPYDTFVIDLGYNDGISVTNQAFVNGVRVGEIVQVHKHSSILKLYSSYSNQIPIRIKGEIEAQAKGQGGGRFVSLIPKDLEVSEGDYISFPDETSAFTIVSKVETTDSDSFQGIFFNLPFNISEISFVQIIEN